VGKLQGGGRGRYAEAYAIERPKEIAQLVERPLGAYGRELGENALGVQSRVGRGHPLRQSGAEPSRGHVCNSAVLSRVGPALQRRLVCISGKGGWIGANRLPAPPPPEMQGEQSG